MHTPSFRLLPLLLLSGACATSSQGPSLTERREEIRQKNVERRAEFEKNYRSQDGFQSTRWGMTLGEVKALYPGARRVEASTLTAVSTVVDRPAALSFYFTPQDQLAIVSVEFTQPGDVRTDHSELTSLMTGKYGSPSASSDSDVPDARGRTDPAAQLRYSLRSAWNTRESQIEILATRTPDEKTLILHYVSNVLGAPVLERLQTEAAKRRRQQVKEL